MSKALRVTVTAAFVVAMLMTGFSVFADDTGLKAGAVGGPTGFPNAQLHQYTANDAAGRAILALKALKAAGKAPDQIVMMMPPGAVGHWEKPFPGGAKAVKDVFKEETGIEIVPVGVVET
jgi:multiple sugar transport system substrate-binding protein